MGWRCRTGPLHATGSSAALPTPCSSQESLTTQREECTCLEFVEVCAELVNRTRRLHRTLQRSTSILTLQSIYESSWNVEEAKGS